MEGLGPLVVGTGDGGAHGRSGTDALEGVCSRTHNDGLRMVTLLILPRRSSEDEMREDGFVLSSHLPGSSISDHSDCNTVTKLRSYERSSAMCVPSTSSVRFLHSEKGHTYSQR